MPVYDDAIFGDPFYALAVGVNEFDVREVEGIVVVVVEGRTLAEEVEPVD